MRVVNTLKWSVGNMNAVGLALGVVFVAAGSAAVKAGVQGLFYGAGFRGEFTVYK